MNKTVWVLGHLRMPFFYICAVSGSAVARVDTATWRPESREPAVSAAVFPECIRNAACRPSRAAWHWSAPATEHGATDSRRSPRVLLRPAYQPESTPPCSDENAIQSTVTSANQQ